MLINWAPIWEGVHVGGGVNLYSQQIGLELTRRGYEVISVFSGFTYNLIPFSYIRTHKPWQQIHSFEIINSPCLAPGRDNSGYPKGELKNRRIIKLFQKILDVIKPDVVHFNNIEGFCSHCVYLARKQGARVIFSLHNYYTVCPQVFLLFKDKEICYDYQDGRRCYHCVPHKSYWLQRIKRGLLSVLAATGNPQRYKSLIYDVYRGYHSTIQSFGEYFHFVYRGIQQSAIESIEQNENPKIHSSYKLRRHSMIDSLNECHEVLAVSDFVAQKFIQMGVNPDLVKVNHVGSSIGKLVAGYRKRHPTISNRQHATLPLRVVFIGNSGNYKGLPVLLEALENLPKRRRADLKLFIYAQHVESLLGRI
jgi:glycosyltransferase involved in cell wall biosynthesis